MPNRALCTPRSGLVARDEAARTLAPRCDVQGCPCRAPTSQTVLPILSRRTAALPGRRPWPNVCLARCQRRHVALPRARRSKPAARGATSRALRALLRSVGAQRRGPHSCAAPRRPRMPVPRAQFAIRSPDALPANRCAARPPAVAQRLSRPCQRRRGTLPRARRSKPAARGATSRALRALLRSVGAQRRGPHSCAAPRRPRMPVPRAQFAIRSPDALPANRCAARPPAVAQSLSRPLPAASRGVAVRATL